MTFPSPVHTPLPPPPPRGWWRPVDQVFSSDVEALASEVAGQPVTARHAGRGRWRIRDRNGQRITNLVAVSGTAHSDRAARGWVAFGGIKRLLYREPGQPDGWERTDHWDAEAVTAELGACRPEDFVGGAA
jgi:hypothetical protein